MPLIMRDSCAGRNAGVLAGWTGGVPPPNRQPLDIRWKHTACASLPFGGADAADPAGETPALHINGRHVTLSLLPSL